MSFEENDNTRQQREQDSVQKLNDFNVELSGTKAGYLYKSSAPDEKNPNNPGNNKREKEERAWRSALDTALADQNYAALYHDVGNALREAENAAQVALDGQLNILAGLEGEYAERLAGANRLPDNTVVFLSEDGNVYTADGRKVESPERDAIVFKDEAMTYEELKAREKALAETRLLLEDARRHQADLGDMRNRLEDLNNPPSLDELKKWKVKLDEQEAKLDTAPQPTVLNTDELTVVTDKPVL